MTSPTSLGGFSTGLTAGGTLLSAFGALQSGRSQSEMFQYQSGIATLNQKIALQNRDYALATGETEAQRYGMGAAQRLGKIRAAQGASGVDVNSGSPSQVQDSQQKVTDIDLAQIRNNAARRAYGFEIEASQDAAQSGLYARAGADAEKAGKIKALTSLVTGTASVADKWLQGRSVGLNSWAYS